MRALPRCDVELRGEAGCKSCDEPILCSALRPRVDICQARSRVGNEECRVRRRRGRTARSIRRAAAYGCKARHASRAASNEPGVASLRASGWRTRVFAGVLALVAVLAFGTALAADADPAKPDNATCLGCHGNPGFATTAPDGQQRALHVMPDNFAASVHGKRQCVECHKDITEIPHKKGVAHKVSCVQCHESLWETADHKAPENARLGVVVQQIDRYMKSIHARPIQGRPVAHQRDLLQLPRRALRLPQGQPAARAMAAGDSERVRQVPCKRARRVRQLGARQGSHAAGQLEGGGVLRLPHHAPDRGSVERRDPARHHQELRRLSRREPSHLPRDLPRPGEPARLRVHGEVLRLPRQPWHPARERSRVIGAPGQPAQDLQPVPRRRDCRLRHLRAARHRQRFQALSDDLARRRNFMFMLLAGTFAFFWTHTALWFYREARERGKGASRTMVATDEIPGLAQRYYRRFPLVWRLAHLTFALSLMMLSLTGMSLFYADSSWAPVVIALAGRSAHRRGDPPRGCCHLRGHLPRPPRLLRSGASVATGAPSSGSGRIRSSRAGRT